MAYLLIEAGIGKTQETKKFLERVKEVREVWMVTGPYDIIAVVETARLNDLGDVIADKIIPNVARVVSCIAV